MNTSQRQRELELAYIRSGKHIEFIRKLKTSKANGADKECSKQ